MTLKLYGSGSIENVDSIVTSASATLSATELGYIDGVTSAIQTQLNNAGKVLQVVRATDGTERSTSSTGFVDVTGLSVTITPQKSDSAILLITSVSCRAEGSTFNQAGMRLQITDSSNNAITGAENLRFDVNNFQEVSDAPRLDVGATLFGWATPATTSAVTYKTRFCSLSASYTAIIRNTEMTGQLFAIEVSA